MAVRVRVSANGAIEVERDGRLLLQVLTRDYESDLMLVASALRGMVGDGENQLTERLRRSERE